MIHSVPLPGPVSHAISPPRSRTRPRIDLATPSLPSPSASTSRPAGMPGPSSRTLISTPSPVDSSSTQAGASTPTCCPTFASAAPTTATSSSTVRAGSSTG